MPAVMVAKMRRNVVYHRGLKFSLSLKLARSEEKNL